MKNKYESIGVNLSVTVAVIFWGVSFIWTNSILKQGFPPIALITFRMLFAAVLLVIASLFTKRLQRIKRKDVKWLLLAVLLEPFIYFIGETYGLKIVNSATLTSIIISTIPIFTLLPSILIYRERITLINIIGVLITLPGILLVVYDGGTISVDYYWGLLILFVAVFAAVGYSMVIKRLTKTYNSFTIVTYQHILATLYFIPLFLLFNLNDFSFSLFTPKVLQPLLALAILCSCTAFILYTYSIKMLGIARTSIYTSLVPAISAFVAFMTGQEEMGLMRISGVVIVVSGVIIAQRDKKRAKANLNPSL